MAIERTLFFIKPDAIERKLVGKIIDRLEQAGFAIRRIQLFRLARNRVGEFYAIHKGKAFYESLVEYISSGPIIAMLLERENACHYLREVVGATDPKKAAPGTIRAEFGLNVERNSCHGSAPDENPDREIAFFFGDDATVVC